MLTSADIAAIEAAIWAHPQGVAYQSKIDQIYACARCVCPTQTARGGGIPGPGWSYKHWKKRKEREDELEQTIRAQWLKLTGNEPPPEIVAEAKQEETQRETVEFVSYQAWDRFAFAQLEIILADLKAREDDDEEALLLLM